MAEPPESEFSKLARIAQISQIGMEMAIPAVAGIGLDYWLNTLPWFLIIGSILGPILAFIHLLNILKQPPRQEKP